MKEAAVVLTEKDAVAPPGLNSADADFRHDCGGRRRLRRVL